MLSGRRRGGGGSRALGEGVLCNDLDLPTIPVGLEFVLSTGESWPIYASSTGCRPEEVRGGRAETWKFGEEDKLESGEVDVEGAPFLMLSPAEDLEFDTRAEAICSNDITDSGGVGGFPFFGGDGLLRKELFSGTLVEEDEDDATGGPEGEILPESLRRLLPMTSKFSVFPNKASLAF